MSQTWSQVLERQMLRQSARLGAAGTSRKFGSGLFVVGSAAATTLLLTNQGLTKPAHCEEAKKPRTSQVVIRPLRWDDEYAWKRLWTAYLTFYETEVDENQYRTTFTRMLSGDPHEFKGLVAELDGELVGIAHYLFHRHGWQESRVCYLQDLYVDPKIRGGGVGKALIEAVYAASDVEGCPKVYWMTQHFNSRARKLYDYVGQRTPFIEYERP